MDWREHCGDKLVSPQQAVKSAVRSGDSVQLNWLHATPLTLSQALLEHVRRENKARGLAAP